jgi:hypothetical protein
MPIDKESAESNLQNAHPLVYRRSYLFYQAWHHLSNCLTIEYRVVQYSYKAVKKTMNIFILLIWRFENGIYKRPYQLHFYCLDLR